MARVYNFSAGPAVLPEEVLRQAAAEMLDYDGTGMSVMEMSHRSKPFANIIETAEADLRELLQIPDNYQVLFLQGGATQQFAAIPMNLMQNKKADYIVSGSWSKKAWKEAKLYGEARCVASSEDENFSYVPDVAGLEFDPEADYVYICQNETIYGTTYHTLPETGDIPLVTDVSSMFLSEPMDVSKYGLIYGGVQKNIGPAGVTIVIARDDLVREDVMPFTPTIMRYTTQAKAKSLSNTPPAYGIYICGLVFQVAEGDGRPVRYGRAQQGEGRHSVRLPRSEQAVPRHRPQGGSLAHERALRHGIRRAGRAVRGRGEVPRHRVHKGPSLGGRHAREHLQCHAQGRR